MIEIEIKKEDIERIKRLLKELDPKTRGGAIEKGMLKAGADTMGELVNNVSNKILKRRTGALAQSIGFRLKNDDDGVSVIVGSGFAQGRERVVYANIHEEGGTIRPKTAKYLTIPLKAAQTPAGAPRFTARQAEGIYEGTFFRRSQAGNLILYGKTGKTITPLFVLKDSVVIPARRYMSITADGVTNTVTKDLIDAISNIKEKR